MRMIKRKRCRNCRCLFVPDPRNRDRQEFCFEPECKKASKAASQKKWLSRTIRLNCNWDYDKLQEIVNNHKTIRQMLGHGMMDDDKEYPLQTLKDNVKLLTPEVLDKINAVVVEEGHKLLVKKKSRR